MNRYEQLYSELDNKNEVAFIPFFCIGNPSIETTIKMIDTAIENGADALEIGFPFSDPVADGPVLQTANIRGMNAGATPSKCFEVIKQIRDKHSNIPIGLLVYGNIAFANGFDNFYKQCKNVGVDSVLIADIPTAEHTEFYDHAINNDVCPIFIAPPNADKQALGEIAKLGRGYTYVVARSGVTGTDTENTTSTSKQIIDELNNNNAPRPIVGFGIKDKQTATEAINNGAKGVIVGSQIAKIIDDNLDNEEKLLSAIGEFTKEIKSATKL